MLRSCSLLFSDDGECGELCSDQLSLVTERAAVNPGLGTALFSQPLLSTHNNNHHIIQRLINYTYQIIGRVVLVIFTHKPLVLKVVFSSVCRSMGAHALICLKCSVEYTAHSHGFHLPLLSLYHTHHCRSFRVLHPSNQMQL